MARKTLKRTVYIDESSGNLCTCQGSFWKTCSLRVANQLGCVEAIVSITEVDRTECDPAPSSIKSLDKSLAKLTDSIRQIENKFKI